MLAHTVYGQISQCSTGGSLHFDIGTLQEEEDRFEGVSVHFPDICDHFSLLFSSPEHCAQYLAPLSLQKSNWRCVVGLHSPSRPVCLVSVVARQKRSRFRPADDVQSSKTDHQGIAVLTFSRYCSRSATASLSLSANAGSYKPSFDRPMCVSVPWLEFRPISCLPPQHEDPQLPMPQVESPKRTGALLRICPPRLGMQLSNSRVQLARRGMIENGFRAVDVNKKGV